MVPYLVQPCAWLQFLRHRPRRPIREDRSLVVVHVAAETLAEQPATGPRSQPDGPPHQRTRSRHHRIRRRHPRDRRQYPRTGPRHLGAPRGGSEDVPAGTSKPGAAGCHLQGLGSIEARDRPTIRLRYHPARRSRRPQRQRPVSRAHPPTGVPAQRRAFNDPLRHVSIPRGAPSIATSRPTTLCPGVPAA